MSEEDEVELILKRARARRQDLNVRLNAIGEAATPLRSPLREKNFISGNVSSPIKSGQASPLRSRSPIKTTYSSPSKSSLISSPNKSRTPTRTGTFKVSKDEDSPSKSTSYSRVYESKDGLSRSEENYNRDCVEKKTTIIDGEPEKGSYTKTTITEREETIEKKEFIKFTEKGPVRKSPSKLLEEYRAKRDKEINNTEKVVIDLANKVDESRTLGSPSRFGSCRDSVVEEVFSSPLRKSRINLASNSPVKSPEKKKIDITDSPMVKEHDEPEPEDDGSFKSGQRKRLKALASKFSNYEEEDSDAIKQVISQAAATGSPYKRDLTKMVDVDKIINRSAPPTHNLDQDPDFVKSLKAQGFEESNSKSKLVYDFKKKNSSNTPTGSRDASPYKNDPMQYIRPQPKVVTTSVATPPKPNVTKSPNKKAPAYRSVSPTRMASPRTEASTSVKPHPLQFISPHKANAVSTATNGPPKPPRTYIDMEEESPAEVFKTEVSVEVVSKKDEERTDTASRRSILEKRSLWETPSEPQPDLPDPAMLPLSQRKALFEKNKSIPKPIARFGESVTPAMLSKASSNIVPASEPAWKRQRRDRSPEKQSFFTPGNELRAKPNFDDNSTPAIRREVGMKKNLFENNWKDNEIAKAQADSRRKDMEVLMNRFHKVSEDMERDRSKSPDRRPSRSPSPFRRSPEMQRKSVSRITPSPPKVRPPSPPKASPPKKSPIKSPQEKYYPGVNSLKRIKVSPPRSGQLYPDLTEINDDRPGTSMSEESCAPSEAPSLGTAIKRVASAHRKHSPMKAIAEDTTSDDETERMDCSGVDDEINDMLDEALEDSQIDLDEGPTPPKLSRTRAQSPSSSSAASWEFQTPISSSKSYVKDFKTPRVDEIRDSPQAELPLLETEEGVVPASNLMHSVSIYRKQKPAGLNVNVKSLGKIVKISVPEENNDDEVIESEEHVKAEITQRINKLQEEVEEQMQRRAQASKALTLCEAQNEFEGSFERVEFERLLLEAHHKHAAATAEINRLKNMVSRGQISMFNGKSKSKGTISISGITMPLKKEFVKLMMNPGHGGDDYIHYFVCLVKYRSQVIATQMLSSVDGINRSGQLVFTNLININELEFDFQIYLEVYGLQTPKEVLSHEDKYHIKKDKSLFNLSTPLKKLKKMESRFVMTPSSNPVNALSIRKSKFGMVGYTTITIDTLKSKTFQLEKVPSRSPLDGHMFMKLNVHSESHITKKDFLTFQAEKGGCGDWQRRWCVFKDNTLYFWKYPEDEEKKKVPIEAESISLHNCFTENVSLAPREVCSRPNTFMLECRRPFKSGDVDGLNMRVDRNNGVTTIRHLLMADSREERLHWCKVLNSSLENLRAWDPTSLRLRSNSTSTTGTTTDMDDNISSASTDIW